MPLPESESALGEGFSLDNYRGLLERLRLSKANQERIDKKVPAPTKQQPAL